MDKNVIQVSQDICLRTASGNDFAAVVSWFIGPNKRTSEQTSSLIRHWAGPNVSQPYSAKRLIEQINGGHYQSLVLLDGERIIGFGQIQIIKQRIHLARLTINPAYRGKRLAKRLLSELIEYAQTQVQVNEASLFVYIDNPIAVACYEGYGFLESATPKAIKPMANCRFMTLRF